MVSFEKTSLVGYAWQKQSIYLLQFKINSKGLRLTTEKQTGQKQHCPFHWTRDRRDPYFGIDPSPVIILQTIMNFKLISRHIISSAGLNTQPVNVPFVGFPYKKYHYNHQFSYSVHAIQLTMKMYCGWGKFRGYQFPWFSRRVLSTNSSTLELVIFLNELWKKILWPRILNPTNVSFLFNPWKLVPTKIKPSTVCDW